MLLGRTSVFRGRENERNREEIRTASARCFLDLLTLDWVLEELKNGFVFASLFGPRKKKSLNFRRT